MASHAPADAAFLENVRKISGFETLSRSLNPPASRIERLGLASSLLRGASGIAQAAAIILASYTACAPHHYQAL